MTDQPTVLIDVVGRIGQITLNRPASINALDHPMALSMHDALRTWANDPAIDAVVVAGAGERGLCAGGDIAAIHHDASKLSAGGGDDAAAAESPSGRFWADEYRLNLDISTYPKPYVAIMDGIVMGGGVGISAHGNTRVVTDRTRLGMPEVGIGFVPDVGGTTVEAATATLQGARLVVASDQKEEFSDQIDEGRVIGIAGKPATGSNWRPGDTVTLVVSKGPELFSVPDVTGKTLTDAKKILTDAGFTVSYNPAWDVFPIARVNSQKPAGGSMQKKGTDVALSLGFED